MLIIGPNPFISQSSPDHNTQPRIYVSYYEISWPDICSLICDFDTRLLIFRPSYGSMLRRKKRAGLSRDGISDGKYELKKYFLLCYKNATHFFNPFSNTIAEAFWLMYYSRILTKLYEGFLSNSIKEFKQENKIALQFFGTFFSTNFNLHLSFTHFFYFLWLLIIDLTQSGHAHHNGVVWFLQ